MNAPVDLELHGDVALIIIDNPPVNALSQPVRIGLLEAIERAQREPNVEAIVLHGRGKNFIGGADIREFDRLPGDPLLTHVLNTIERSQKPVIAALHGAVLGGGFETALASHFRCSTRNVQIGLPEVKLGLLPGAGGTQRLPRLVGLANALDIMITGKPVDFRRARALSIIDHVIADGDLVAEAIQYARMLVSNRVPIRRIRDLEVSKRATFDEMFFEQYRNGLPRAARDNEAVNRIITCTTAAVTMTFEDGLALSRELFDECRRSRQSAALRHLFFSERAVGRSESLRNDAARPVERICIVGAGTMGSGIALSCATGGYSVALMDTDSSAVGRGLANIKATVAASVKRGRIDESIAAAALARVEGVSNIDAAADADLIIEAVFENMAIKQDLFARLSGVARPDCVLATNTSTLDVDAIADNTKQPKNVGGMHFFSPANVMPLVEVVRARRTSPSAVATMLAVTKRLGKIGVVVGNGFGFVGNRMLYALGQQNQLMMLEGASPECIDEAMEEWGMAMGPNAVGDLAGLDVGYRVRRESKNPHHDPHYYRVADILVENGRLGQKTRAGYYRYEGTTSRERQSDPKVHELIRKEALRLSVPQRRIERKEIVERCIYALINEGARLLEERIAESAADIDVIWCNGYGFPRTRGGPMFYADEVGLGAVYEAVCRYRLQFGARYWEPAPLLARLAKDNKSFAAWRASSDGIPALLPQ